jgi:autotransporter-associated beta strand protein
MQLRIFCPLLILAASTLCCVTAPAAPRPNIQQRIDQLLVANGRMGLAFDTTSAGTLTLNTPSGPQLYQSGLVTLTGPIHVGTTSSGGSLVKVGAGTLTLLSANGFYGATTTSGGTLRVTSGTTAGIGFTINGGAMNFTNGNVLSLDPPAASNPTGGGGLILNSGSNSGSGSVTLSGSNSYSGSTTINSGTLNIGGGTYVDGTTTTTGTLQVGSGTVDLSGGITVGNAGTITFNNAGTTNILTGLIANTGATTISGGTLALANTTALNAGNLVINSSQASLRKLGTGTLILGGVNSSTGAITDSVATLSGTGSIGGSLARTESGGVINMAGSSAATGTLTFNGSLMLNGGTFQYDIDGSQLNGDSVRVIGGLSTAGSTPINLKFLNPTSPTSTSGSTLFTYNGLANSSGLTTNTWSSTSDALDQIHLVDSIGSSDSITLGPVSAVPEPTTLTLGLIALTLLLLSRRLGI